ncbi:MAG TPA: tetratricopeptide repeat protein, partial [Chroococcales cyanobacterium]
PAAGATANTAATDSSGAPPAVSKENAPADAPKVLLKPGQPLNITMAQEDLVPTDDVELARQQAIAYPDSPEASFILAVALTRTSRVEEALKEVRRARRLAQAQGGAVYFDKMISQYEKMLEYCPDENRVRYGLAWAYYMKAYLLSQSHPMGQNALPIAATAGNSTAPAPADTTAAKEKSTTTATVAASTNPETPQSTTTAKPQGAATATVATTAKETSAAAATSTPQNKEVWANAASANQLLGLLSPKLAQAAPAVPGAVSSLQLPQYKGALEKASPDAVPQIKQYYEAALKNLDDLLARNPKDVWARVYRAHLYAEYTGDLSSSMKAWSQCQKEAPQNPAPYFFLGQGYLKQGNLKESLSNISRAIALRAVGN